MTHLDRPASGADKMTTIYRHDGTTLSVPAVKRPKFNPTTEAVSWARWTWNPVHGCLHGCEYCYAWELAESSKMAKFYPEGFAPMFRPERLAAPKNSRVPVSDDPRDSRVFVGSMGDLFGEWVPQEWIDAVMGASVDSPQWTYLFLTKFPQRYARLPLPPSVWLGTSVDTQARVRIAERAMSRIPDSAVRWLSCEPLQEPLTFTDLSWCDWLVIGGRSRARGLPAVTPPTQWVTSLMAQADAFGVPVYLKPTNMPPLPVRQEMPRGSTSD